MDKVASAKAPVLTLKAPLTPSFFMLKNTLTTSAFNGIPNKFMITDLCESGIYLLLRVPMEGKYMPTHASKPKKAATIAARGIAKAPPDDIVRVATPIEIVANTNIKDVNDSVETFLFTA